MRRMTPEHMSKFIRYLPLDKIVTEPGNGHWEIWVDCWWVHDPEKGLLFYQKTAQCNEMEWVSRKVAEVYGSGVEVIRVPRVCVPHNCGDYL